MADRRREKCQKAVERAFAKHDHVFCAYCGIEVFQNQKGRTLATGDHIKPLCLGGKDEFSNITVSCFKCNQEKGSLTVEEFLAIMDDPSALWAAR